MKRGASRFIDSGREPCGPKMKRGASRFIDFRREQNGRNKVWSESHSWLEKGTKRSIDKAGSKFIL
jgi:hypothetical protein